MIRFGTRVALDDGKTPILRDFSPGIGKAFVEYDEPVEREAPDGTPLGLGDRAWVPAPGWSLVRDKDGVKIGMAHESEKMAPAV